MDFSALKSFDKVVAGFSGIWLVFLLYPLQFLLTEPAYGPAQKIFGVLCLGLFCLIYLLSFGAYGLLAEPNPLKKTLYWNLLLLVPALGLTLVLGGWIFYVSTYCVALWCYHEPVRLGLKIGAGIALISAASMFFFFREIFENGGFGFVIGSGFIVLMALLNNRAEADRIREKELAEARQAEKIARDVHDILGHTLTVINLKAELATALAEAQPDKARDEMQQVAELSRTALAEVRATVTRMKTPNFVGELEAARRALETARITAHLPSREQAAVPGNNATLFGWVLREAVTNVVRHSKAQNCWVSLEPERIEIVDDGGAASMEPGNGLTGLSSRVQEAGGDIVLSTGSLTRVLVTMNGDTTQLISLGTSA